MRNLFSKIALFSFFAFSLSLVSAADVVDKDPSIYDQFKSYLSAFPEDIVDGETQIKISFMITEDSEVVVLKTSDADLDAYVKGALNYKELTNHALEVNKVYVLPVTLQER